MPLSGYAFDATARTYDTDGRMHISRSHISKANVCPYYGREIPGSEGLGLDPNKIYRMLRDPEELRKAAPTFARLPILSKHIPITAALPSRDLWVGTIGSDVEFLDPYLDADTAIWVDSAIAGVETDTVREFSSAYHFDPVMSPGLYKGEVYDGVMTNIRGNHLALVESGRAGSDVLAADSKPRELDMKMTKLGKALCVALGTAYPTLAQDSLPSLLGQATKATFNKPDVTAKLIAMDANLPTKQLETVMDAILAVDEEPAAKEPKKKPAEDSDDDDDDDDDDLTGDSDDETEEEKREREKREKKVAQDAKLKRAVDAKLMPAMDAYKTELREADEARRAVRPVVGDVIAQDSAAGIYGFALDHMQVGREGVTGVPALKALFNLAHTRTATVTPRIAQDSAGLAAKFPGVARIRQA